ncbi:MAG TPA: 30S ribosomal protein S2 [Acidimicrobiales bacterium]|nr:30S ribosomal protein S2 [Acidimicrobiales bacterium]
MAVVTMKQLLEAGVHFGHQTRRWNPKMKRFIFGERNGIYIIDLDQTLQRIETAYAFVRDLVAGGGTVLFVGTKRQAQDAVQSYAEKCGMPYVNHRWLGGMLTNFQTMSKRVGKMQELQRQRSSGEFEAMPKREALQKSRELAKLEKYLSGIRTMERQPDAVFILDTKKEHIAVTEANKLGIPIVAVVDTNCDPDSVQYVIPGNDDAIRSGTLMCRVIADAVAEGRYIASRRSEMPTRGLLDEEKVAQEQAEARRQALAEAKAREARLAGAPTASGTFAPAAGQAGAAQTEAAAAGAQGAPAAASPTPGAEADQVDTPAEEILAAGAAGEPDPAGAADTQQSAPSAGDADDAGVSESGLENTES